MGMWTVQVSQWHDIFAAAASASAALLGLLFVGLSLHVRLVVEHGDVRALARQTLTSFLVILVTSLCVLIPATQGPPALGAELAGIGAVGAFADFPGAHRAVTHLTGQPLSLPAFARLVTRFAAGMLGLLSVVVVGALLMAGERSAVNGLIITNMVLLISATQNTWDLIVTVAATVAAVDRTAPTAPMSSRGVGDRAQHQQEAVHGARLRGKPPVSGEAAERPVVVAEDGALAEDCVDDL